MLNDSKIKLGKVENQYNKAINDITRYIFNQYKFVVISGNVYCLKFNHFNVDR